MKPKTFLSLLLIVSLPIAVILGYVVLEKIGSSYVKGYSDGLRAVTLSDLCVELKETAVGTDFIKGYGYSIFECKIIRGDWEEDWEISEGYEVEKTPEGVLFKLKIDEGDSEMLFQKLEIKEYKKNNEKEIKTERLL